MRSRCPDSQPAPASWTAPARRNWDRALKRLARGLRCPRGLGCDRGQDAVEYVLLVVLIGLSITGGMLLLSTTLDETYTDAAACIADPSQGGSQGKGGGKGTPGGGKGQGTGPPASPCP